MKIYSDSFLVQKSLSPNFHFRILADYSLKPIAKTKMPLKQELDSKKIRIQTDWRFKVLMELPAILRNKADHGKLGADQGKLKTIEPAKNMLDEYMPEEGFMPLENVKLKNGYFQKLAKITTFINPSSRAQDHSAITTHLAELKAAYFSELLLKNPSRKLLMEYAAFVPRIKDGSAGSIKLALSPFYYALKNDNASHTDVMDAVISAKLSPTRNLLGLMLRKLCENNLKTDTLKDNSTSLVAEIQDIMERINFTTNKKQLTSLELMKVLKCLPPDTTFFKSLLQEIISRFPDNPSVAVVIADIFLNTGFDIFRLYQFLKKMFNASILDSEVLQIYLLSRKEVSADPQLKLNLLSVWQSMGVTVTPQAFAKTANGKWESVTTGLEYLSRNVPDVSLISQSTINSLLLASGDLSWADFDKLWKLQKDLLSVKGAPENVLIKQFLKVAITKRSPVRIIDILSFGSNNSSQELVHYTLKQMTRHKYPVFDLVAVWNESSSVIRLTPSTLKLLLESIKEGKDFEFLKEILVFIRARSTEVNSGHKSKAGNVSSSQGVIKDWISGMCLKDSQKALGLVEDILFRELNA